MSELQKPNYACKTVSEVEAIFGPPAVKWELDSIEKIEERFGVCEDPTFRELKTKSVSVPGFGEDGSKNVNIRIHILLEKLLLSAFTEIKNAKLGYLLYDGLEVGGQFFRYKKNDTTNAYLKNRSEYAHLKSKRTQTEWDEWAWASDTAQYDAQNGKLGELVDIGSKKVSKKSLLSNHSWGTAFDINSGHNPFKVGAKFDMRKEIVAIMANHGFRWGGYYHDYMHFEYTLDHIIGGAASSNNTNTPFKFPVNIGSGIDGTAANATAYFNHTEKDASGGYFPVGTNTVWHGGVHIRGKEKDPIHACFDGKIIAARLSDNPALSEGHYGSRNFLLLEHQFGKSKIYCLYMHLYSKVLSNKEIQDGGYKWLLDPPKVSYEVASGQSVSYRSLPGVNSNPNSKELGTLSAGSKLEILSTEKDPDGDSWNKIKLSNGTVGYIIASSESKGRIRKVASGTTTGEVNQTLLLKIKSGRVEKLDIPVKAGDSLWGMGQYGSEDYRTSLLHWEVFSTENVLSSIKGNVEIKDLDDDFNMDSSNIMHLFKKYQNDGYWDDDEILEPDELRKFFQSSTEREFVRKYSCQFTSEWGIVNLEEAIRGLKGRWVTYGLKDRMKPYIWWQDAFNAGVGIPKSASVWHFNPIFTLQHFGGLLAATTPSTPAPGSPSPQIPSGGGNANTNWTNGYHRNITDQNKYNSFIQNSATAFGLNPFILKSLIAQESGFDPKARNNGGYAGLTQVGGAAIDVAGFNIGDTAKSSGKWVFDLTGDERFDPEKSIQGGAKVLAAKIKSVNTLIFKKYTSPASDDEKIKFYLAAYNGGEGTVLKAYKACGVVNAKWDDLIKGRESSGLWAAIPESWGQEKKYDEITKYVEEIIARASQGGSAKQDSSPVHTQSNVLGKGHFDDKAVKLYSTKTTQSTGYLPGDRIYRLQEDLLAVGVRDVGTPDGDFGAKTEQAVRKFQDYAMKEWRYTPTSTQKVSISYKGKVDGFADKNVLDELTLWLFYQYTIPEDASATPSGLLFPLAKRPTVSYKDGGRFFGASRSGGRSHAGCDLIAPVGTSIYAIDDGVVIQAAYAFYEGTEALEIRHNGFVVRYGEILPGSAAGLVTGTRVVKGQQIAKVGKLNSGSSMLHFEMYSGVASGGLTVVSNTPYMRRSDLIDPTSYLDDMVTK